MHQGTFSSKFANVQSGQHYCEGKMSIPGKHSGGQKPVLNTKGTRAKRDMLSCRKRLSLKCSWLILFKKSKTKWNLILIFLLITKTAFHRKQLSQDNRVKNEKLKRKKKKKKNYLSYRKTRFLLYNLVKFHKTCASF